MKKYSNNSIHHDIKRLVEVAIEVEVEVETSARADLSLYMYSPIPNITAVTPISNDER